LAPGRMMMFWTGRETKLETGWDDQRNASTIPCNTRQIFSAATFVPFGGDQSLASFEHGYKHIHLWFWGQYSDPQIFLWRLLLIFDHLATGFLTLQMTAGLMRERESELRW
jgi:hypothetical protein